MKFVIVIAASVASAVLVLPTVTQAEEGSTAKQVQVAASAAARELRA
jgi:hypothetical protein